MLAYACYSTYMTNIKCGGCSTFQSPIYHNSIAEVRACFEKKYAPKLELALEVEAPEVEVPKVITPGEIKTFDRFSATCYKPGCKTHAIKDHPFKLHCSNHGKVVKVKAKQLKGQYSDSEKHRCNDACMYATGPTCVCSCGGVNHSIGYLIKL